METPTPKNADELREEKLSRRAAELNKTIKYAMAKIDEFSDDDSVGNPPATPPEEVLIPEPATNPGTTPWKLRLFDEKPAPEVMPIAPPAPRVTPIAPTPIDRKRLDGAEPAPKTPTEQVNDFINEFNIGPLLPVEFGALNEAQALKVVQDLKRRIVDIVKSDAQTQYSEDLKKRMGSAGIIKIIKNTFTKERDLKNMEGKVFRELRDTEAGRKLIADDLKILTERAQERDVYIAIDESPCFYYLNNSERYEVGQEAFTKFTVKANNFAYMPYEWGQEKNGKHKKAYEKAKSEYENARNEILKIKGGVSGPEKAIIEMSKIDNALKMEQLLNTHPEFEKVFMDFSKSAKGVELGKTAKKFFTSTSTSKENIMIGTAGAFLRTGTKLVPWLLSASMSTVALSTIVAAPVIGGVTGWYRGKIRGKKTLQERQKEARHGQEDKSIEANKTIKADKMALHLENILDELGNPDNSDKKQEALIKRLKIRIDVARGKIEQGLMDFGDVESTLDNQFILISNLNRAIVETTFNEGRTKEEVSRRVDKLLSFRAEKISNAQKAFIKKQALRGAMMGAGMAGLGSGVRWAGENFGWWEWMGKHLSWRSHVSGPQTPPETPAPDPDVLNPEVKLTKPEVRYAPGAPETEAVPLGENHVTPEPEPNPLPENPTAPITEPAKPPIEQTPPPTPQPSKVENFEPAPTATPTKQNVITMGTPMQIGVETPTGAKAGEFDYVDDDGTTRHYIPPQTTETPSPNPESIVKGESGKTEYFQDENGDTYAKNNIDNPNADTRVADIRADIHEKIALADQELAPTLDHSIEESNAKIQEFYNADTRGDGSYIKDGARITPMGSDSHGNRNYRFEMPGNVRPGFFPDISERENVFLQQHPEFVGNNKYNFSGKKLLKLFEIHEQNLNHVFRDQPDGPGVWKRFADMNASTLLKAENKEGIPIIKYVQKLKKITGLSPEGGILFRSETTSEYIARALQTAAKMGATSLELVRPN